MYDGSKYDLEQNIRYTKEIVEIAHMAGVSVEAEIGSLARGAFSDEEEGDGTLYRYLNIIYVHRFKTEHTKRGQ